MVSVVPASTFNVPPAPVSVIPRFESSIVNVAVVCNAPPFNERLSGVKTTGFPPTRVSASMRTVPRLIVSPPCEFNPPRINVPAPLLINLLLPLRAALIVVFALDTTTILSPLVIVTKAPFMNKSPDPAVPN
jgi:hypothetical protein